MCASESDEKLKTTRETQIEALKSLADWTKWLIAVETAITGAFFFRNGGDAVTSSPALACFILSMLIAAWLLGAIPTALQKTPILDTDDTPASIYTHPHFKTSWFRGIPLLWLALLEHAFFMVGLLILLKPLFWVKKFLSFICLPI